MAKEVKNVPDLRFPGFNEDWNERTLSDSIKILKSGLSRELSTTDIGLPVIRANNLQNYNLVLDDIKYWFKEDPKGAKTENYYLEKNDILVNFINSEAKMGTSCIIKSDFKRDTIYTTNILRYVTKEAYDSYFHYIYTQTYNYKKWIKIITKPAVNQASFTTVDFKKIPYYIPEFKEQQKIGDFFSKLDRQIELEEEKLELLEQQKKGYIQKIFSQELRFKEDNNNSYSDWEIKMLEEISDFQNGKAHENFVSNTGKFILVNSKFISTESKVKKYVDKQLTPLEINDIAIVMSDVPNGKALAKCYLIENDNTYTLNQRIGRIFNIKGNSRFLFTQINRNKQLLKSDNGVGQTNLKKSEIIGIKLYWPNKNEQEKIGTFFSKLDTFIEKQSAKIEILRERKKALLQKMFI